MPWSKFRLNWSLILAGWIWPVFHPFAGEVFRQAELQRLDQAVQQAVQDGKTPGAVLLVEHRGLVHQATYGQRAVQPASEPMQSDTIFDLSSLTKVVATTPALMLLVERHQLALDDPAQKYLPDWQAPGAAAVTLRHLLTHTSGLLVGISGASFTNTAGAMAAAFQEKPRASPGTEFHYCDLNFILLGEIIHRVSGQPLDAFAADQIFRPLGLRDTTFRPAGAWLERVAPTQAGPNGPLRGLVHDATARRMDGVAGHAGLFSTVADLARYARLLLHDGEWDGVRLFQPETVRLMTSVQTPTQVPARRGLGWDIDSGYSRPRGLVFPLGSYGHSGFTGTMLWIDPFSQTFVILLTNRLHPDGQGNVTELYAQVGTLAALSVADFDFHHVERALPFRSAFISWGSVTNLVPRAP